MVRLEKTNPKSAIRCHKPDHQSSRRQSTLRHVISFRHALPSFSSTNEIAHVSQLGSPNLICDSQPRFAIFGAASSSCAPLSTRLTLASPAKNHPHNPRDMAVRTAAQQTDLTEIDLETGAPRADQDDFDTRTANIEQQIDSVYQILAKLPPDPTTSLQRADQTVSSVRQQLSFLAEQNRALVQAKSLGSATLRIRVTRFGKLARDFSSAVTALEAAREKHRAGIADGIIDDVLAVDPSFQRGQVDDALKKGQLDSILRTSDKRFQIEDLRDRNRQLERLTESVNALRELFVEMGFLTENQQSLINEIEHNVEGVKKDVADAEEQIIAAERYKRKITKKKMIIAAILLAIIAVIVIIIVVKVT